MTRALLATLALAGCIVSQHDASRYGTVTVSFGDALDDAGPWRPDQLVQLRAELVALNALGPTFVEASEGAANVVVRPFDSGPGCALGVGRYHPGADYVEVDPACAQGYDDLRAAVGHELGHYVGMAHVCAPGQADPSCDARVAPQYATMNPNISFDVQVEGVAPGTALATPVPTAGDLQEFRLTHP